MKYIKILSVMFFSLIFIIISSITITALTYQCNSCSDCSNKIQNASADDIIQLNTSISNQVGNCIEFGGKDNITFDCLNNYIDASAGSNFGVYLSNVNGGASNNIIKNCNITDFNYGIYIESSSGSNIITDIFLNSNYYGVWFAGHYNIIKDSSIKESTLYDIWPSGSCSINLTNVIGSGGRPIEFYNYSATIQNKELSELILCNAHNSIIDNVTIRGSDSLDNNMLYLTNTYNVTLSNINSSNNKYGIWISQSSNNNLTNIITDSNNNDGIYISSNSDNNILTDITTNSNGQNGIYFYYGSNNIVTNITANSNSKGIHIDASSNNSLTNLTLNSNAYGILLTGVSQDNTINNSFVKNNAQYGIYLLSPSSKYNTIYNNIFNNTVNYYNLTTLTNYFNTTNTSGTNIIGGSWIGGNFWAKPDGTGFSETCTDSDSDGICDSAYTLNSNNSDYLPLAPASVPNIWECNSCSDCSNKIQNANAEDIIQLTTNINNQIGTCIDFNGTDDITFDCLNNYIDGDDTGSDFGIYLSNANSGSDNNIIKNCNITDFSYGIYIESSSNNNTITNTFLNSNQYGIFFAGLSNIIKDSFIKENSLYDLYPSGSCSINLTNVTGSGNNPIEFYNYSATIENKVLSELILCNADNSIVDNVTIRGSDSLDNNMLYLTNTYNVTLSNINSSNNKYGIWISQSSNNNLTNIITDSNNNDGIYISSNSDNNILTDITTNSNSQSGIYVYSSSNNDLINITANSNSKGIHIDASSNNNLINSNLNSNDNYGILLASAQNNTINNSFVKNNAYGIYFQSISEYNTIYNNLFNNTVNYYNSTNLTNYFNTTNTSGTNIIGGSWIGGNFWAKPDGTGFSDTCTDSDSDGICDSAYNVDGVNQSYDYLPLAPAPIWESKLLFTWDDDTNNNPTAEILDISNQKPNFTGTLDKFSIKLVVTLGRNLDAGDGIECRHCETAACSDSYIIGSATETSTPLNTEATYYINSTDSALLARIEHDGVDTEYLNCYALGTIRPGEELIIDTYVNL